MSKPEGPPGGTPSARTILEIVTLILTVMVCLVILRREFWPPKPTTVVKGLTKASGVPSPSLPGEPLSLDGAALRGDTNAPLVLIIFSDFQCPFCARFAKETWPEVDKAFVKTGKAQAAFRHLPLKIHPRAFASAAAAECAGQQGAFWEMHDLLFADPKKLDDESLYARARTLKLDERRFQRCLATTGADRVGADFQLASRLRISGTPTVLLGRREADGRVKVTTQLKGVSSLAEYAEAIEATAKAPAER